MSRPTPAAVGATAAAAGAGMSGEPGAAAMTCPEVTIMIGVFFDGTGNNATNALTDPASDGSHANAPSNVAKLFELYYTGANDTRYPCGGYDQRFTRIYMDGIGTIANGLDVDKGMRWGTGETGVEQRVFDAALKVGTKINELKGAAEPKQIILDVFGFSRGAAAARYFTNGFNAGELVIDRWGPINDVARVPEGRKIDIGFLGVFDTVAAIGLPANTRNGDVNVHLKSSSAMDIYHLTAADEFRNSFRLNKSEGAAPDIQMPGAHSDVGGGYPHDFDESPKIIKPRSGIATPSDLSNAQNDAMAKTRQQLNPLMLQYIDEGWIEATDIPDAFDIRITNLAPFTIPYEPGAVPLGYTRTTVRFDVDVHLVRTWVTGHLAYASLHRMHKEAKLKRVPFLDIPENDLDYQIPSDQPLADIAPKLINGQALSDAEKRIVKRGYTHHSAHYNKASYWFIYPMEPTSDRTRQPFPNISSRAR